MAIKKTSYRSSGKRKTVSIDYRKMLTTDKPHKSLLVKKHKITGRNYSGKITVRHRGGGHKRHYRIIDFKRGKDEMLAVVKSIEYDPNRSAFISLLSYHDGSKSYIIAPHEIKVGDQIISSSNNAEIKVGNCLPLSKIPEGTLVHNVELYPNSGAQLVRSAGSFGQILGSDETGQYIIVKLPSNEIRKFPKACRATIGKVSNEDHGLVVIGKAGRTRWKGIRPTVRGSVMNPNDHPHGGGEGRTSIGRDAPRTPWGKRHMGVKTRKNTKSSTKLIVRRRNATKSR